MEKRQTIQKNYPKNGKRKKPQEKRIRQILGYSTKKLNTNKLAPKILTVQYYDKKTLLKTNAHRNSKN
jgi:hypothetical protein